MNVTREELLRLLRQIIRDGAEHRRRSKHTVPFEQAAWASVDARSRRRRATRSDLRHYVRRMLRVPGIGRRPLRNLTTKDCRELLAAAFGTSDNSFRKGRTILHSIFSFGFRREWCDTNPVDRIEAPIIIEREIVPLSPGEIQRLRVTAAKPEFADFRLPLYLMLYCGVRPTEVNRIDAQRDINWVAKTVTIRPACSKTGGGRVIPLRCAYGLPHRLVRLSVFRWQRFRRTAGFRHWVPDVLRHTFASYHAAYFHNFAELQLEMGHRDASLLRTRYVNAGHISERAAADFWQRGLRVGGRCAPRNQPADPDPADPQ